MEAPPIAALPRPSARWGDVLRVVGAMVGGLCGALARGLVGRRINPNWPFGMELVVAATRGSWSLIPLIGMVRWRNVAETLSPLVTNGLTPRFVNLEPGAEGPLYAAWLEPPDAGASVLLYLHGGGFVYGSLRTHGELIGSLARAARARTLALEYRLAPEHPAPAAVTDCVKAYRHLLALGIAPENIALAGDSAGGALVLYTLFALREAGLPGPGAAVLISPLVDLSCSGDSFESNAPYDYVAREYCQLAIREYLAGADPANPELSPMFDSLSGLPPVLLQAGALEVLVDQIRAFAARAREVGTALTYAEYPDMVHAWHILGGFTPDAARAFDEAGAFIREHTRSPS